MLKIAVCDDDKTFLRSAQKILQQDERAEEIRLYSKPETLLDDLTGPLKNYDAVFLDIELGRRENGIDLAARINSLNPEIEIIYVTGYNDKFSPHVLLGAVEPLGYMTKPLRPEIVSAYLDKICKKQQRKAFITFNFNGKEHTISQESILYMESSNHTVIFHTDSGKFVVYDKLDNLFDKLSSAFIRCHKSYVVNMNRIQRLERDKAWISADLTIPVSKANRTQVRTAFFKFIGQDL